MLRVIRCIVCRHGHTITRPPPDFENWVILKIEWFWKLRVIRLIVLDMDTLSLALLLILKILAAFFTQQNIFWLNYQDCPKKTQYRCWWTYAPIQSFVVNNCDNITHNNVGTIFFCVFVYLAITHARNHKCLIRTTGYNTNVKAHFVSSERKIKSKSRPLQKIKGLCNTIYNLHVEHPVVLLLRSWAEIDPKQIAPGAFSISLRLSQQVDVQRHTLSWNVSSFDLQHSKSWLLDLWCVLTERAFPRLAGKLAFTSLSLIVTAVQNKRESQKSREREIVCMSSKLKQKSQSPARNCQGNRPQTTQWHHFHSLPNTAKRIQEDLFQWCSCVSEKSPQQQCASGWHKVREPTNGVHR